MPSKRSRFIQRCVADVAEKQGGDLSSAFAICTAQSQKSGYSEPGSLKQTGKGKAREKYFKGQPDMAKKGRKYEKAVKAARKEESDITQCKPMSVLLGEAASSKKQDSPTKEEIRFKLQLEAAQTTYDRIVQLRSRLGGRGTPMDARSQGEREKLQKKIDDSMGDLEYMLYLSMKRFEEWRDASA